MTFTTSCVLLALTFRQTEFWNIKLIPTNGSLKGYEFVYNAIKSSLNEHAF